MKRRIIAMALGLTLCMSSFAFGEAISQDEFDRLAKENEELLGQIESLEAKLVPVDVESKVMTNLPSGYYTICPSILDSNSVEVKYTGEVIDGIPNGKGILEISVKTYDDDNNVYEYNYELDGTFNDYYLLGSGDSTTTIERNGVIRSVFKENGNFHYGKLNGQGKYTDYIYSNGEVYRSCVYEGNFEFGIKEGKFKVLKTKYLTSRIDISESEGQYYNDYETGYWKEEKISEDGNVLSASEGHYGRGYQVGKWMYRNNDGDMSIREFVSYSDFGEEID